MYLFERVTWTLKNTVFSLGPAQRVREFLEFRAVPWTLEGHLRQACVLEAEDWTLTMRGSCKGGS